ncbi:MAG: ABC transporter substrate-binding protein, partial [Eubacteriaceae bacterium]
MMKQFKKRKQAAGLLITALLVVSLLTGCGSGDNSSDGKKTFTMGDTTFNTENEEADVNPHSAYSGWACIRYGVGETLFRYSDSMEVE